MTSLAASWTDLLTASSGVHPDREGRPCPYVPGGCLQTLIRTQQTVQCTGVFCRFCTDTCDPFSQTGPGSGVSGEKGRDGSDPVRSLKEDMSCRLHGNGDPGASLSLQGCSGIMNQGKDMKDQIDEIDRKIIEELRLNSRCTVTALGRKLGRTSQAIRNRLEKLEDIGIIQQYTVSVNCPLFGYPVHALFHMSVPMKKVRDLLSRHPDRSWKILHLYSTIGAEISILDMVFTDTEHMRALARLLEELGEPRIYYVLSEDELQVDL